MSMCDHMSMLLQISAATLLQSLSGFEEASGSCCETHVVSNELWASFIAGGGLTIASKIRNPPSYHRK